MYQVLVKWFDNGVMNKLMTEKQLRVLPNVLRGGVSYAKVITPSGVTKEITHLFE